VYRIAIQPDNQLLRSGRRQSFSDRWQELAGPLGYEVRLVDSFKPDFFTQLEGCDGFMWWFAHVSFPRLFAKRLMVAVQHGQGIPVFPSWQTIWHFDDKIAQQYLLQAADIPTPQTWVFWRRKQAITFCQQAQYPLVIKLATGITSENVRLLRSFAEARYWIKRLFGYGMFALRRRSLRRWGHRALRWLVKGQYPSYGDLQKGYLLIQEFLPGNEFDTRVTVIGDRAFAFRRFNRPNDFRASGSGRIDHRPDLIELDAVRLAFQVARALGTQSLAVDVLRRDREFVLNEISYYYEGWAVAECPGHWKCCEGDRLEWIGGRMSPEDAIIEDFLTLVRRGPKPLQAQGV
jgi:hypothetical protein